MKFDSTTNGLRKEISDLSANISPISNEAKIKDLHKSLQKSNEDKERMAHSLMKLEEELGKLSREKEKKMQIVNHQTTERRKK